MDTEITRDSLPECLAEAVAGCRWQQVFIGCSTSHVFRLERPNRSDLFLKIAPHAPGRPLLQEKLRLEWLRHRLPVPQVQMFRERQSYDYLLLSEIPGMVASDEFYKRDAPKAIEQVAAGLAMIHNLPADHCPFDATLDYKIELARERMMGGLVDESDFDRSRLGRTAIDLFAELLETRPDEEELVFTHGDFCLTNIILKDWRLSGFIDCGGAGVADKYQDISLLARSVELNYGAEWVNVLFESCGIKPDPARIHFYTLLDEFF